MPNLTEHIEVRMDGVEYASAYLQSPFNVKATLGHFGYCYYVKSGSAILANDGLNPCKIELRKNYIVSVSGINPHYIQSAGIDNCGPISIEPLLSTKNQQAQGDVQLLIGRVNNPSLAYIGAYIGTQVITPQESPVIHKRIRETFNLIENELSEADASTETVVRLLSETVLLNVIRYVTTRHNQIVSPLNAAYDRRIVGAMMAIGSDPCRDWSISELAQYAGMSRTAFSVNFHKLLGKPPMEAVRYARLTRAATLLDTTNETIEGVADRSGYHSSAAFVRAFKKVFAVTPARWRRRNSITDMNA